MPSWQPVHVRVVDLPQFAHSPEVVAMLILLLWLNWRISGKLRFKDNRDGTYTWKPVAFTPFAYFLQPSVCTWNTPCNNANEALHKTHSLVLSLPDLRDHTPTEALPYAALLGDQHTV